MKTMTGSTEILISVDHFTVLLKGKKSQLFNLCTGCPKNIKVTL
jgi:hypothetical protein